MIGPAKPRRLDRPIAVSLEDLVPQDHFYRHLEAKLDLRFVREWVQEPCAERGRPSTVSVVAQEVRHVAPHHLCGRPGARQEPLSVTTA